MSKSVIRIRFLSLNDVADQSYPNIILYLKKLTQVPTSNGPIELYEKDPESPIVRSFGETFDSFSDDEYFQILFIEPNNEPKVIADLILWHNHLLDLIHDSKHNKNSKSELACSIPLERSYVLKFSLQLVEEVVQVNQRKLHIAKHQSILGHSMAIKQFNRPAYCAICNKFIWGLRHQGYQCLQCSLVTDKKCHQRISFWCQKSPNPDFYLLTGNHRVECNIPHVFKRYESSIHRYCNHCGSQVIRNALKCKTCNFIVHKKCEINVPPMCTSSYDSIGNALTSGIIQIGVYNSLFNTMEEDNEHDSYLNLSEDENANYSNCSSMDFTWLDPLPKTDLKFLPKFSDFECIGRLGSGRYGNVYCVQHIPSKEYFAIKVIDGTIEEAKQQFEVERQILFRFSQKNHYMIKGYCSFHQGNHLFLVMESVDGDTLNQKIQKTRMNENEIRFYLVEMISVLEYLHSNNIVYRDLKLEHIIINSEGHIRLVDYGLGRLLKNSDEMCYTVCGTNGYMAPEVHRNKDGLSEDGYSYPVDYWALGMMFVQMLCGEQFDFHPENNDELNYPSSLTENLQLSRQISSEARSLLNGLLEIDPKKRLGSVNSPYGSLRDHPFFQVGKGIDWQAIDDGVCKSIHKRQTLIRMISDLSVDIPLPTLLLDRGTRAKFDWTNAGESRCTANQEEQLRLFDYVNQSTWSQFNQVNSSS